MSIAAASAVHLAAARSSSPGSPARSDAPAHGGESFEAILGGQLASGRADETPRPVDAAPRESTTRCGNAAPGQLDAAPEHADAARKHVDAAPEHLDAAPERATAAPAAGTSSGANFFVPQSSTGRSSTPESSAGRPVKPGTAEPAKSAARAQAGELPAPAVPASPEAGAASGGRASDSGLRAAAPAPSRDEAQPPPGADQPARAREKSKSAARPGGEKSGGGAVPIAQNGAQSGPAAISKAPGNSASSSRDAAAGATAATSRSSAASHAVHDARKPAGDPQPASPVRADKSALTASSASGAPSSATREASAPSLARAAPVPFAREAGDDSSLQLALLPQAAHMRMDVNGSDLALHLRLRDGVAHVTVSGEAAAMVADRSSDLRSALSAQGLRLGSVEQVQRAAPSGEAAGQPLAQQDGQADSQARSRSESGRDEREADRLSPAPGAAARDSRAFTISRSTAARAAGQRKEQP